MFGDWTGIPTGQLGLIDKNLARKFRS